MASNNIMNLDALLKSFDNLKLSTDFLNANSGQAKALNDIYAAIEAQQAQQAQQALVSPRTRDWLKENYGIVGENQSEIEEQLAVLKELGQGESKMNKLKFASEGAKNTLKGASAGADFGAKLAQQLPETKETLAAGPRGFGVVGRK